MSEPKISSITRKIKLQERSERYPREDEILIFSDISELDHVIDMLDSLGKELHIHLANGIPDEEWSKLVSSPITALIAYLRNACIEYERFWRPNTWKPENDIEFMAYMNDPQQLHYLVCMLKKGRSVETEVTYRDKNKHIIKKETKNEIRKEPAYFISARSLELALNFKHSSGGVELVDGCINELKFYLTRYHAAALEIVQYRNDTYTKFGKERKKQSRDWGARGGAASRKHSDKDHAEWVGTAKRIRSKNRSLSWSELARRVTKELNQQAENAGKKENLSSNTVKSYLLKHKDKFVDS